MFSMEPVTNWPCIDQQIADIEMSYRTCAQVSMGEQLVKGER